MIATSPYSLPPPGVTIADLQHQVDPAAFRRQVLAYLDTLRRPDGGLCQGRQPERRGRPVPQHSDIDATRYGVAALIQAGYVDGVFCNAVCRAHWPW